MTKTPISLLALSLLSSTSALAADTDAIIGGALGGGVGAAVGSELGGRKGAVIGAAIGGGAGAAIATHDESTTPRREIVYVEEPVTKVIYTDRHPRHPHGMPPGQAKKRKHWR